MEAKIQKNMLWFTKIIFVACLELSCLSLKIPVFKLVFPYITISILPTECLKIQSITAILAFFLGAWFYLSCFMHSIQKENILQNCKTNLEM